MAFAHETPEHCLRERLYNYSGCTDSVGRVWGDAHRAELALLPAPADDSPCCAAISPDVGSDTAPPVAMSCTCLRGQASESTVEESNWKSLTSAFFQGCNNEALRRDWSDYGCDQEGEEVRRKHEAQEIEWTVVVTYVLLLSNPTKNVTMSHHNNILLGPAPKVLSNPLSPLVQRLFVSSIKTLLASPVRSQRREVKSLKLWILLKDLLCRASIAWESITFLQLRKQNDLAEPTKTFNSGSVTDLGTLKSTLEGGGEDDLGTRLQVLSQG